MKYANKPRQAVGLTLAVATLLGGCGGMPKSQALLNAERAYADAKADPEVLRYAATELGRAEQALNQAQVTESADEMEAYAYIGERRVGAAQAVTEKKLAQEALARLGREQGQVQLEMRELEANRARAESAMAQQEREQAVREREQALAETRKLQQELKALQAEKTARGMVMTLGDVLFATGKADLLPGAMDTIDRLAQFMREYPGKSLLIEGHTDSVGSEEYNQRLSERRALSVKDALASRGIDSRRIRTLGLGETRPVADNATDAGRLKNRRVEIVIQD